jgi:glutamate formiminotransferase/formiminotetrahydrofolate cyclodeaminase
VAALCIRSAVLGAGLNVRINAAQLKDVEVGAALVARADGFEAAVSAGEAEILAQVRQRIV